MSEDVFIRWRDVLLKLQEAEAEIKKTQAYSEEIEMIRLLKELVKEQVPNENIDSAAS